MAPREPYVHDPHHNPRSTARIAGHPLHPMIIPFPITFFLSALVTDICYVSTNEAFWAMASRWLIVGGLVMSVLAALTGMVDFGGDRRIRKTGIAWLHMIGNIVAVLLQLVNLLLRPASDPGATISSTGLIISILVAAILGVTAWAGGDLVYRHGVGVLGDKSKSPDRRI